MRCSAKHESLLKERVFPIRNGLQKVMVGQRRVIDRVTMSIFAVGQRDFYPDGTRFLGTGHVLCEGGVGTGKTVLCKTLSMLLSGDSKRVSGMPDALASDITGCDIILLTGDTKTVHGPIFCNVMLADEINRFPPKAQNAFIEALAEGTVTIGEDTYHLKQPFFCLATQNPTEQKGTSRMQEALSDRFMFKLIMDETTEKEKIAIAERTHHFDVDGLKGIVTTEEVYEARKFFFDNTYVSECVRAYSARILHAINHPSQFGLFKKETEKLDGGSIFKQKPPLNDRTMLHMEGAAMMEAVIKGREYVLPTDVYNIAADVLRARLIVSESSVHVLLDDESKYNTETQLVDYLIAEVLQSIEIPECYEEEEFSFCGDYVTKAC